MEELYSYDLDYLVDALDAICEEELSHYGTPRHSGRYPWGSGENPYQHDRNFVARVRQLKKEGVSETEIAKSMKMSTGQLRAKISIANDDIRKYEMNLAVKLKDKGYSNTAIAKRINRPESTVRNYLKPVKQERANKTQAIADLIQKEIDKGHYIDIGHGTEQWLGISDTKLKASVEILREKGYAYHTVPVEQLGTGHDTTMKVICPPGTKWKDVKNNLDNIKAPNIFYDRDADKPREIKPPVSIDSSRVSICYAEDGGKNKDGVIEIRRGVKDLDLGKANYAQVRIAVDGTHYIKGMAMYTDDPLPPGVDIRFNTNKHSDVPKMEVLKPMKTIVDKDGKEVLNDENPFGASIKNENELLKCQKYYIGDDGKEHQSALNIVNEEGNWREWSKTIASQVLSKQPPALAKKQLQMDRDIRQEELNEIQSLTNPIVKKMMLEKFADECDSAAVDLKAAGLPGQASHVILPMPDMKENEIFAPNYPDGETVILIRYPHGGKFEIPTLTVNNKNPDARRLIGPNAPDAVGIHPKTAERLSGADFDGDTVLVIPNRSGAMKTSPPLEKLKDFDPKESYGGKPDESGNYPYRIMLEENKGKYMGSITNLITDMTIKGASDDEIARAVKHSMVVIDAPKHKLNYEQSYIDNGIAQLKEKYQGGKNRGASTLISKASAEQRVPVRTLEYNTHNMTPEQLKAYKEGAKIFRTTPKTYSKFDEKKGEWVQKERTIKSTKMYEELAKPEGDAHNLSSGTQIEEIDATHANSLRTLGNDARKEALSINEDTYNATAAQHYSKEVAELKAALNLAKRNAPLERQAQILAKDIFEGRKLANPDMDKETIRKEKARALKTARERVGAHKAQIQITDRQWEAIQAGAIKKTALKDILENADLRKVKQLAMPRNKPLMSSGKIAKAKALQSRGYTNQQIAEMLGVSTSTLYDALNPKAA